MTLKTLKRTICSRIAKMDCVASRLVLAAIAATALLSDAGAVSVQFGNATNFHAGNYPGQVVVADFNHDGKPDIAVARTGGMSLMLGQSGGALANPISYSFSTFGSGAIASGDFNNDGKLDLAQASWYDTRILLGDGNGNFSVSTNHMNFSVYAAAVAVGDFNGDGKADLAMVNTGNPTARGLTVGFGRGDGSFNTPTNYALANTPGNVRVGDLNGDGRPDLAISLQSFSSANSNSICILSNKGDGTFGAPRYYAASSKDQHDSLELADFNRDGKLDIAVLNSNPNLSISNSVSIWLNNGSGTFAVANRYLTGFPPKSIVSGEFNGDGSIDLIIRGGPAARILTGNGDGSFIMGSQMSVPSDSTTGHGTVAMGDFDGDGKADVAFTSYSGNSVAVKLNQTLPGLEMTRVPGYNQITWNAVLGAGFTLECTTNLLAPDSWNPFPYPPVSIGTRKGVADWSDGEQKFYRLRKP